MRTSICQIALSVTDRARSLGWYTGFGLVPSGSMGPVKGDVPAKMLALDECDFMLDWLDGRDPMVQLELFEFTRPQPKKSTENPTVLDEGYGTLSLVVPDFDAQLIRAGRSGGHYSVSGEEGRRSLWLRDPDGISVEILEKDPLGVDTSKGRPGIASIRGITLTVASLERAKRFFLGAVGFVECASEEFHFNAYPPDVSPSNIDWNLTVAKAGTTLLRLLEPRAAAMTPRPSGYRLNDIGVLNVAVIVDTADEFAELQERIKSRGYRFCADSPMILADHAGVLYGHDDQGNSIEVGFVTAGHEQKYGWHR